MLIDRKPKLSAECEDLLNDIEQIPDLEEGQVKEILEELEQTNLQILLRMKEDILMMLPTSKRPRKERRKIMISDIQGAKPNWKLVIWCSKKIE